MIRWPETKRARGARRIAGADRFRQETKNRFGDDHLAALTWAMSDEGKARLRELTAGSC